MVSTKAREAEINSCFEPKVEFCNPQDKYDHKKTFLDLESLYRENLEKKKIVVENSGNGKGEYMERDNLTVLDEVTGLADRSHSFLKFLTKCRKFGYSVLYIFHKPALSSPQWKDILSQTQVFCVFSSAMDLVLNHLVKFITRSPNVKLYVSRQQLWLTNLVRTLAKKPGYSCFCLDKRPHVFGAARYRSQVENPETQYCYLNSSTSDKLFNSSVSKRTDDTDQIQFIIEKQVGKTDSGQVYELKTKRDGTSDDRGSVSEQQQ